MDFKTNKPIYKQIVDSLGQGAFHAACRELAHRAESLRIPASGGHHLSRAGHGLLSLKGCHEESDEDTEERIL